MSSPLLSKSTLFADRVLDMADYLLEEKYKNHIPYSLKVCVEQVARSGTSIGANIAEGTEAQSKADLTSKNGIALKEARETQFWLGRLLNRGYITQEQHDSLMKDLTEILKMLISSIATLRRVENKNPRERVETEKTRNQEN